MDSYLIDGHKLLWHLDRVAAWQAGQLVAPIYMEVSPVSYCNHRCIFCGVDFAMTARHKLETETTCARLAEMAGLGVRSLMFAGEGEPLLHEELPRLVGTAKRAGIDVSITSNGSLGTPDLWAELLPSLTWLRFSLDAGSAPVHAQVHGVAPKVFERTVASIAQALEQRAAAQLPVTIGAQFLVLPENIDDLENAMDLAGRLGLDYLALKSYSLHPQMVKKKDVLYQAEMVARIGELVRRKQPGLATNLIFRQDSMASYQEQAPRFGHCHALPFWAYLASDGNVYTCSVFLGQEEFKAGNIYEQDMEGVFFGEARRRSVEYGSQGLDVCAQCRVNCRMARINEFLDVLSIRPPHVNFI